MLPNMKRLKLRTETLRTLAAADLSLVAGGRTTLSQGCRGPWDDSGCGGDGRAPGPDDLIVPLPPDAAASRRSRTGEPYRGHDYSGKR
jgi:hypothetical protein